MQKPKKGDTLFLVTKNSQGLCSVKSVGRKYLTIESGLLYRDIKFEIETWRQKTDYTPEYYLYESEHEWHNKRKHQQYMKAFMYAFTCSHNSFNLEQLEKAAIILEIKI